MRRIGIMMLREKEAEINTLLRHHYNKMRIGVLDPCYEGKVQIMLVNFDGYERGCLLPWTSKKKAYRFLRAYELGLTLGLGCVHA